MHLAELGVLWGEVYSGNIDRAGVQMRNRYQPSASDLPPAHLVAASDARRHRVLQALRPMGRAGPRPAGSAALEGRAKCVC